jgi:hypothetical protein
MAGAGILKMARNISICFKVSELIGKRLHIRGRHKGGEYIDYFMT